MAVALTVISKSGALAAVNRPEVQELATQESSAKAICLQMYGSVKGAEGTSHGLAYMQACRHYCSALARWRRFYLKCKRIDFFQAKEDTSFDNTIAHMANFVKEACLETPKGPTETQGPHGDSNYPPELPGILFDNTYVHDSAGWHTLVIQVILDFPVLKKLSAESCQTDVVVYVGEEPTPDGHCFNEDCKGPLPVTVLIRPTAEQQPPSLQFTFIPV
ncbi:hypothetical protein K439DRAFT_1621480 [Ramaria rubella]|nr:hypothetical protein K439DRAFT_1621480 [Ramaria rubella]